MPQSLTTHLMYSSTAIVLEASEVLLTLCWSRLSSTTFWNFCAYKIVRNLKIKIKRKIVWIKCLHFWALFTWRLVSAQDTQMVPNTIMWIQLWMKLYGKWVYSRVCSGTNEYHATVIENQPTNNPELKLFNVEKWSLSSSANCTYFTCWTSRRRDSTWNSCLEEVRRPWKRIKVFLVSATTSKLETTQDVISYERIVRISNTTSTDTKTKPRGIVVMKYARLLMSQHQLMTSSISPFLTPFEYRVGNFHSPFAFRTSQKRTKGDIIITTYLVYTMLGLTCNM